MGKRSETIKPRRTAQSPTTTRKTATTLVAASSPYEAELLSSDNSDLAHLLSTTNWAASGALDALFEASPDGITVYGSAGRIVRANAIFRASLDRLFPQDRTANLQDLHDRLAQHPLRTTDGDVLSNEEWPQTRLLRGETLSGSSAAETLMYTAEGEAVYWSVSGAPLRAADGRIIGAVAIHRDITEQKRLEYELRQRRDGVQTYSITGKAQWRNVTGARLRSEGGTITRADLVNPDSRWGAFLDNALGATARQMQASAQRLQASERQLRASERQLSQLRQLYELRASEQRLRATERQLQASEQRMQDSQQQLQDSQQQLQDSQRQLGAALEISPVGFAFVDATGKATLVNQAVKTIWGEDVRLAQSRADYGQYKAWWPESGKRVKAQEWGLARALRTSEPQPADEIEIEALDGARKTILNANAPLLDEEGAIVGGVSIIVDITERRQLEDEARRARALAHASEEVAQLCKSMSRGGVAGALREWQSALDAVNESVEAEIYACVAELVVEWLQSAQTFDSLLEAYFHPDPELTRLIAELCTSGEFLLRPHLVMGASCALRLRQLVATIGV